MTAPARFLLFFTFILLLCLKLYAQISPEKDVYLKIQPEIYNPIILIFPPFEGTDINPLIPELQQTIRLNLEYSGFFDIITLNSPNREQLVADIVSPE